MNPTTSPKRPDALKPMDVEDVVRWACGQELIKPRPSPGAVFMPRLADLVERGGAECVGPAVWPQSYPSISPMFAPGVKSSGKGSRGGPPDPDALRVEEAILTLPGAMANIEAPAALTSGLGFAIDREGAFRAAAGNAHNLLIAHGRLGNRPAPGLDRPSPLPKLAANGKPGAWRMERIAEPGFGERWIERERETAVTAMKRRDQYPDGAYGRLVWEPDPTHIVNERAEYLAWRLALGWLAEILRGELERIEALAPRAAIAPWLGDVDGEALEERGDSLAPRSGEGASIHPGVEIYSALG